MRSLQEFSDDSASFQYETQKGCTLITVTEYTYTYMDIDAKFVM
jgi:hypothetical protein